MKTTHFASGFLFRISSRFHGLSISSINIAHEIQTGRNQSSETYIYCMSCVACLNTVTLKVFYFSRLLPFNLK